MLLFSSFPTLSFWAESRFAAGRSRRIPWPVCRNGQAIPLPTQSGSRDSASLRRSYAKAQSEWQRGRTEQLHQFVIIQYFPIVILSAAKNPLKSTRVLKLALRDPSLRCEPPLRMTAVGKNWTVTPILLDNPDRLCYTDFSKYIFRVEIKSSF